MIPLQMIALTLLVATNTSATGVHITPVLSTTATRPCSVLTGLNQLPQHPYFLLNNEQELQTVQTFRTMVFLN